MAVCIRIFYIETTVSGRCIEKWLYVSGLVFRNDCTGTLYKEMAVCIRTFYIQTVFCIKTYYIETATYVRTSL